MKPRLNEPWSILWPTVIAMALGFMLTATSLTAKPFGIAVHIPNGTQLDLVNDVGADWIRIDFIWAFVEPEQDVFDWARYDRLISDSKERNLRIFATISGTPAWATSGAEGSGVPSQVDDWFDICYRAAARYRGQVEAWGMWNEPNLDHFWEGTLHQYRIRILQLGADAVHAADSQAMVAGPELAHLSSANWEGWLLACVTGAFEKLDVVTHHVYPSGVGAGDVTRKLEDAGSYPWDPPSVKDVLQDAGWFGRPFWLTETGVETDAGGPWAQAVFYDDLLTEWFPSEGDAKWIDRMFFYQLFDDPRFPDITFGIVGPPPDLEPKLAFDYYEDFIQEAVVDDARVLSWATESVLEPGRWNRAVVRVINEGTTTWRADDELSVSVVGLPGDWGLEGGLAALDGDVAPGSISEVSLDLRPPLVEWGFPNQRHDITVRMARRNGNGLGSTLRAVVISGWYSLPVFERHPLTSVVDPGGKAVFRVVADGAGDLDLQWFHNGILIRDGDRFSGTKTAALTVHEADAADTGDYWCRVETSAGWVLSNLAELLLTGEGRGDPREGEGRSPENRWEPMPSFESFFADAAKRREEAERLKLDTRN